LKEKPEKPPVKKFEILLEPLSVVFKIRATEDTLLRLTIRENTKYELQNRKHNTTYITKYITNIKV